MVLAKPGSVKLYTKFKAAIYLLKKEEGGRSTAFSQGYKPQFFFRTTDVTGTVTALYKGDNHETLEMAMPGDNIFVEAYLTISMAINIGLRFAIREAGRTIGSGVITEIIE